jgi:hypothetical protein
MLEYILPIIIAITPFILSILIAIILWIKHRNKRIKELASKIKPKVYVLAGNHQQFIYWLRQHYEMLKYKEYVYISGPEVLLGTRNPKVVYYGSWIDRKDVNDIMDTIRSRSQR